MEFPWRFENFENTSLQSHKDAKRACVLDFKPMSEEVAGKAV
jgi:hypothetical protein